MKRALTKVGLVAAGLSISAVGLAEGAEAVAAGGGASLGTGLIAVAAGLAIGMAAMGAASGQGRTAAAALEGIARNPGAAKQMFTSFILGLAFMEFQAFLGFAIAAMLFGKL